MVEETGTGGFSPEPTRSYGLDATRKIRFPARISLFLNNRKPPETLPDWHSLVFGDRHSTVFQLSGASDHSGRRRLWERLNPRHRKDLRMLAEALAFQQSHGRLPEPLRFRLAAALTELQRVVERIAAILAEVARRTPSSR